MSKLTKFDINKVCRTCLMTSDDLKSLYETCFTSKQLCLAEILTEITSLKCWINDGLPTHICQGCTSTLTHFQEFQLKCLESEQLLRDQLDRFDEPVIPNVCKEALIKVESLYETEPEFNDLSMGVFENNLEKSTNTSKLFIQQQLSTKTINTPLKTTEIQADLNQELDLIKHEIIKTEIDEIDYKTMQTLVENSNITENRRNVINCTVEESYSTSETSQKLIKIETNENIVGSFVNMGEKTYSFPESEEEIIDSDIYLSEKSFTPSKSKPEVINMEEKTLTPSNMGEESFPRSKIPRASKNIDEKLNSCENSFRKQLTVRMRQHTKAKPFSCTICPASYHRKQTLDHHMQTHDSHSLTITENAKPYSCTTCLKQLKSKTTLMIHMRRHTGEKPYTCPICKRAFAQSAPRNVHMRTHSVEKLYACTICDTSFNHKISLTCHMRKHIGTRPFSCTVCDKRFNRKTHLADHSRTHTGETPFPCAVCNRYFNRKDMLSVHMRTHTGERPYACTFCDSSFNHKVSLTTHMWKHTGKKPYACTGCDKSFYRKAHLKVHVRQHTGEKPYRCAVCEQSFYQKDTMTVHMMTHTGEKPFACAVCGRLFNRKSNLTVHERTHNKCALGV